MRNLLTGIALSLAILFSFTGPAEAGVPRRVCPLAAMPDVLFLSEYDALVLLQARGFDNTQVFRYDGVENAPVRAQAPAPGLIVDSCTSYITTAEKWV